MVIEKERNISEGGEVQTSTHLALPYNTILCLQYAKNEEGQASPLGPWRFSTF